MKKYLFIDTNIFIQLCAQEKDGDKLDDLKEIKRLIENKKVYLLMPEVVKLELGSQIEEKFIEIEKGLGVIKEFARQGSLNKKIKEEVVNKVGQIAEERRKNSKTVEENIGLIMESPQTIRIKIEPQHLCDSYARYLSKTKPFKLGQKGGEIQPDCMIIEALKRYLSMETESYKLYFCSQNISDFCLTKDEKRLIHPDIVEGFSGEIIYYENLFQMVNDNFGGKFSAQKVAVFDQALDNAKIAEAIIKSLDITESVHKASREMAKNLEVFTNSADFDLMENLFNQLQKSNKERLDQIANLAQIDTKVLNAYKDVLKDAVSKLNESRVFQYINQPDLPSQKVEKEAQ